MRKITLNELKAELTGKIERRIKEVIIHHTWAPKASEYRGLQTWQAIRDYHMRVRGWSDIGYHYGVAPDGSYWALRPVQRPGAHTLHRNENSIGVVLVGNYDVEKPDTIIPYAARLCETILRALQLPVEAIRFHREFQNKTCPGMLLNLQTFRDEVAKLLTPRTNIVKVLFDGEEVVCNAKIENGITRCDLRPLVEALGFNVEYHEDNKIYITLKDKE